MSILGTIEQLQRVRAMCEPTRNGGLFDPADGGMSDNQLAEQWYAYRLRPMDYPHTLNRHTVDADLRKHFRL